MTPSPETFFRKLDMRDALSAAERDVFLSCIGTVTTYPAGSDIVKEGERPSESKLLLGGFASRYRDDAEGRRQISAIHVAGDFVDLHSFLLRDMDHSVGALSDCQIASVPHARLRMITEDHPHLTRLLWLSTLIDAAMHREWLMAAGRPAPEQLAHLICELYVRLAAIDAAQDHRMTLPLTQVQLGETLGLSTVHVNRTVQQLRQQQLLTWQGPEIQILDWASLCQLAGFDGRYLHLTREPR